jgi:hypothetical protein
VILKAVAVTSQEPLTHHLSCFAMVPDNNVLGYSDLSKEAAAIKAQLLVLVSRLDDIEQEMIEH